ncbi:hypothetical protein EMIT0P44_60127 [Pseudomonas sp. IT-P44]
MGNANQLCAELNIVSDTKPVGAGLLAMASGRSTLDFPSPSPASWLLHFDLRWVRSGR